MTTAREETEPLDMGRTMVSLLFWIAAALVVLALWSVSSRIQETERDVPFSELMTRIGRGHVERVSLTETQSGIQIRGDFVDGPSFRSFAPPQTENLVHPMLESGVEVSVRDSSATSWVGHVISWAPIVIMIAFLVFFMRTMQGGSQPAASPIFRLRERQEKRLEMKALFLQGLLDEEELSEPEMMSLLSDRGDLGSDEIEARKALYEMLGDGTVQLTEGKKYRLRTAPAKL